MNNFITFEGPDGAGKTTVLNQIKPWLEQLKPNQTLFTREPGGDVISEDIRKVILDAKNTNMNKNTELLLYEAARSQLVSEIIKPALAENKMVICDRYIDSTTAYQGGGNHFTIDEINYLNHFATQGLMPTLTIYYDVPVEVGLNRINKYRTNKKDRLDLKTIDYHQTVSDTYQQVIKENPDRIQVIDGTQSIETRVEQTKKLIKNQFAEWFEN